MITLSNVSKTYQGYDIDHKESGFVLWAKNAFKLTSNRATSVQALRDVSFDVARGEIFGIYGANGAGKTTLIKVLSGLLLADAGRVSVNGHTGSDRIKEQVSYVSTNGWMGLEWQLSAYENVLLYGTIFGLPRATLRGRCDAALRLLGMYEARGKQISELSAGMRQKVTLARGFLLDRPILYLDEPTVSLDVPSALALRGLLAARSPEAGPHAASRFRKTILITSHNPLDLEICDRCLLLHEGRVLAVGTMDELRAPLRGIEALHVSCSNHRQGIEAREMCQELRALDGVHGAWLDASNGHQQTWQFRLLIRRDQHPTGAIVDRFIAHELPIVALQTRDVTLQEIYRTRMEAADVG
jgi:ABC-2 type transport system ATP-binding protein